MSTGGIGSTCEDHSFNADAGTPKTPAWDWVGVIGTGQSLSVGTSPIMSQPQPQPFHNLKLSLGDVAVPTSDAGVWDAGDDDDSMSMVPLTEPIRAMVSGFPRP